MRKYYVKMSIKLCKNGSITNKIASIKVIRDLTSQLDTPTFSILAFSK